MSELWIAILVAAVFVLWATQGEPIYYEKVCGRHGVQGEPATSVSFEAKTRSHRCETLPTSSIRVHEDAVEIACCLFNKGMLSGPTIDGASAEIEAWFRALKP